MAKKENVVNPELRKIGLDFYKGPFRFDSMGGYVWANGDPSTNGSQMFADLDQASERCARIRGWGALSYLKDVDCEALQDEIGRMFAEAITEYWDKQKNTITATIPADYSLTSELTAIHDFLTAIVDDSDSHYLIYYRCRAHEADVEPTQSYKLRVPTQGIDTTLLEGDIVTLQQGRVSVYKQQN